MKAFFFLLAFNLSLLAAEPPAESAKVEKKVTPVDDRKSIEALRQEVTNAYRSAAKARHAGNVIDPDPEGANVIPTPEGAAGTEYYLRLKKAYLSAKAALNKSERESRLKTSDF